MKNYGIIIKTTEYTKKKKKRFHWRQKTAIVIEIIFSIFKVEGKPRRLKKIRQKKIGEKELLT